MSSPPPPSSGDAATSAAARTEVTLAWAWAGFRTGAVAVLLAAFAAAPGRGAAAVPETVLTLIVVADCAVVGAVFVRVGRMPLGWAAADVVCVVAVVGCSSWPAVVPGVAGQSVFYNFTVIVGPTIGLPAWPPVVTLAGGAGLAFVDLAPALRAGSSYPRWNALPDAVTVLGLALLATVLARLQRGSAEALDRHRRAAVRRASQLARQGERLRQQADLSAHLMTTLEVLTAGDVIADPAIADRLRGEASGLRRLLAAESAAMPGGGVLSAALRELAVEKSATGLHVDVGAGHDGSADALPPAAAAALVAATREALTNVRKHAKTDRAVLTVEVVGDGVRVTVADQGCGYDPGATGEGFGQRRSLRHRIAAEGGRVDIDTAPGAGTRVRLWVPFDTGGAAGPR